MTLHKSVNLCVAIQVHGYFNFFNSIKVSQIFQIFKNHWQLKLSFNLTWNFHFYWKTESIVTHRMKHVFWPFCLFVPKTILWRHATWSCLLSVGNALSTAYLFFQFHNSWIFFLKISAMSTDCFKIFSTSQMSLKCWVLFFVIIYKKQNKTKNWLLNTVPISSFKLMLLVTV